MKTEWNYSELAKPYLQRPAYSTDALESLFKSMFLSTSSIIRVCDIGAGIGHLTIPLLDRGFRVDAVEPNNEMRDLGKKRTQNYDTVLWSEATGEFTQKSDVYYDVVTFGSSFNVTDRRLALNEAARILKPEGWFVCMWNHRDLNDSLQQDIEKIIKDAIPHYDYGSRREDQTSIIQQSDLFKDVKFTQGSIEHIVSKKEWGNAWNSHATLARQAGEKRAMIVANIKEHLNSLEGGGDTITIPYVTKIWFAQKK